MNSYQLNWCKGVVRTSESIILMTRILGFGGDEMRWSLASGHIRMHPSPKTGVDSRSGCAMRRGGGDAILNNLYHLFGNLRLIFGHTTNENNKFSWPRAIKCCWPLMTATYVGYLKGGEATLHQRSSFNCLLKVHSAVWRTFCILLSI